MEQNYSHKIIPNSVNSGVRSWREGEISLEYEGCLLEPLLELGFFGTDFVISAQSWSFQVCMCLFNGTEAVGFCCASQG